MNNRSHPLVLLLSAPLALLPACGASGTVDPSGPSPTPSWDASGVDSGRNSQCDDDCHAERPGFPFAYSTDPAPGLCVGFIPAEERDGAPPLTSCAPTWCCSDPGLE